MRPRYRVPQPQLPLAHPGKARGKDVSFPREDGPHGPQPLVGSEPLLGMGGTESARGAGMGCEGTDPSLLQLLGSNGGGRRRVLGGARGVLGGTVGHSAAPYQVPEAQLPLTHLAEAGGEDLAIGHEDGADGPGAVVRFGYLLRWALAG